MRIRKPLTASLLLLCAGSGCERPKQRANSASLELRVDSAQYTVRYIPPYYHAEIAFHFANGSADTLSATHCRVAPVPDLEKEVDARWVRAYTQETDLCLTLPPFQVPPGGTHDDTLHLQVAPRSARIGGAAIGPALEVDTIVGRYRLRWALHRGADPQSPTAAAIDVISNAFSIKAAATSRP